MKKYYDPRQEYNPVDEDIDKGVYRFISWLILGCLSAIVAVCIAVQFL